MEDQYIALQQTKVSIYVVIQDVETKKYLSNPYGYDRQFTSESADYRHYENEAEAQKEIDEVLDSDCYEVLDGKTLELRTFQINTVVFTDEIK